MVWPPRVALARGVRGTDRARARVLGNCWGRRNISGTYVPRRVRGTQVPRRTVRVAGSAASPSAFAARRVTTECQSDHGHCEAELRMRARARRRVAEHTHGRTVRVAGSAASPSAFAVCVRARLELRYPSETANSARREKRSFSERVRRAAMRTDVSLADACSPAKREPATSRSESRSLSGRVYSGKPRAQSFLSGR